MKTTLWLAAVLAATTISGSALAHGRNHDDWRGQEWRAHRHHHHHHHYHRPPPPPVYWQHHAERPVVHREPPLLLPPSPHEVHRAIRDALFGR